MTIHDVFAFLAERKDAYLVTDTKYLAPAQIRLQFDKMVEAASAHGWELLNRIIPQIYTAEMLAVVEEVYAFPRYILTLYQTAATDAEVLAFVQTQPIAYVTMSVDRYNRALVAALNSVKVRTYVHTINETGAVKDFLVNGVFGFYTDILTREQVLGEKRMQELETRIRGETLRQFARHFAETTVLNEDQLASFSSSELEELAIELFRVRSPAEASDVLRRRGLS
jgi:hypothetical protein